MLLAGLYLCTNVWQDLGPFGAVRFVSPFYYANFLRALVPGHGLHIPASLGLAAASAALLAAAAWVYRRRDYGAGLWTRRRAHTIRVRAVQRPALRAVWSATLLRQRWSLLTWSVSAAVTLAFMGWLEPTVADMWDEFQYTQRIIGADPNLSVADQYLAFAGQLVMPIVTAYVLTQAAGWVTDLRQGRVELLLAVPLTWPRLVGQRLLATLIGAGAIMAAAIAGLSAAAVTTLAIFVAASYLLIYLVLPGATVRLARLGDAHLGLWRLRQPVPAAPRLDRAHPPGRPSLAVLGGLTRRGHCPPLSQSGHLIWPARDAVCYPSGQPDRARRPVRAVTGSTVSIAISAEVHNVEDSGSNRYCRRRGPGPGTARTEPEDPDLYIMTALCGLVPPYGYAYAVGRVG